MSTRTSCDEEGDWIRREGKVCVRLKVVRKMIRGDTRRVGTRVKKGRAGYVCESITDSDRGVRSLIQTFVFVFVYDKGRDQTSDRFNYFQRVFL